MRHVDRVEADPVDRNQTERGQSVYKAARHAGGPARHDDPDRPGVRIQRCLPSRRIQLAPADERAARGERRLQIGHERSD
jgi:hypothetical protein